MKSQTKIYWHLAILIFNLTWITPVLSQQASICSGTTSKGSLKDGVKLPKRGGNYQSYSDAAWAMGRTYVHSKVYAVMLEAYREIQIEAPKKVFVYGETGWKAGGRFRPHKTHQNGLSVDFMVPVINKQNISVPLACSVFNKFCYSIEFDRNGKKDNLRIDFEAMAEHIYWLHKKAIAHGIDIWRVIFDPKLQHKLNSSPHWPYLKKNIQFSKKRSWVRHDEHYHVDFKVKCLDLKGRPALKK